MQNRQSENRVYWCVFRSVVVVVVVVGLVVVVVAGAGAACDDH